MLCFASNHLMSSFDSTGSVEDDRKPGTYENVIGIVLGTRSAWYSAVKLKRPKRSSSS
eukprot:SAG11_NODE_801_length_7112_cov_6.438329_4_plen_58_part_00